jgi:hypothetical protein
VRGVRRRLTDLSRDLVDRAVALGEEVDDLGPASARQRLGDLGEALEQRVLRGAVSHRRHRPRIEAACQVLK